MVGNRALTALYWVIGFVLAVLAGVAGAAWGNGQAPTFGNDETGGTPATGASRLLFSLFGGLLAGALVLAVFAAIFMVLWLRDRRSHPEADDYEDDEGFLDHVEFGDEDDEESVHDDASAAELDPEDNSDYDGDYDGDYEGDYEGEFDADYDGEYEQDAELNDSLGGTPRHQG